ncbi:Glyco-18 domain-containing protein [Mycena sanguinolenta]|uniref:Glyco-18 domain-containing protein n=1 Tax=Mycena sanguinolenta TaxID=230812 RepID=A0A8H6YFM5_9AGAR|nr:Glyco-18 domain-containing protein [Mycena sanguinolenta]
MNPSLQRWSHIFPRSLLLPCTGPYTSFFCCSVLNPSRSFKQLNIFPAIITSLRLVETPGMWFLAPTPPAESRSLHLHGTPPGAPFIPENISWNQYTHMVYAFGLTTPDPGNITGIDDDLLKDFLYFAKSNGVSPVLSIRGWSGAQYFFTAVATSDSRTQFIDAILALVSMYDLDGIDFERVLTPRH